VSGVPLLHGPLAQRLELPAHNRLVPGSNPGGPISNFELRTSNGDLKSLMAHDSRSGHVFYRRAVWLPIALPSLVAALFHGLGLVPTGSEILTLLLASLVYGGLPYAPIALFATFWIDGRPEAEIRRRAVRAPFWMIVSFLIFCVVLAIVSRQLIMPAGVFVLGAIASLALQRNGVGEVELTLSTQDQGAVQSAVTFGVCNFIYVHSVE
jgi:hypothetical protein